MARPALHSASASARWLAFRAGERRFGIAADQVREVARIPRLTAVPQAPASLLGIANVRSEAVAVVSVAGLLGLPGGAPRQMILIGGDHPAALAIDRIEGVVADAAGCELIAFDDLLQREFPARLAKAGRSSAVAERLEDSGSAQRLALLSFSIGEQLFAFPLDQVEAVLRVPAEIARFPHADAAVIGTMAWREGVVPLLSLAALLGLPGTGGKAARVVVVRSGSHSIGLTVDRIDRLLTPSADSIDAVPAPLLRGGGETVIQAIHRPAKGRLISILGTDQLLHGEITAGFAALPAIQREAGALAGADNVALLLVRYGGHRFAFPLAAIHQVGRAPTRFSPVPHAPPFLPGLTSHRDAALPVIDLSIHMSGTPATGTTARLLIVSIAGAEAGLLVDKVDGIVRVPRDRLEDLPTLGDRRTASFEQGVTLAEGEAFTLVLSPDALFSQVEADFITHIARGSAQNQ